MTTTTMLDFAGNQKNSIDFDAAGFGERFGNCLIDSFAAAESVAG